MGPEYDKEEIAKWHRTELEKEEVREQMQRQTRSRLTLLRKGTRKWWAASKIPAELVELRTTDGSEKYQPPAKHRDGHCDCSMVHMDGCYGYGCCPMRHTNCTTMVWHTYGGCTLRSIFYRQI